MPGLPPIFHVVAAIAYAEDQRTRRDLSARIVADERDYVSRLITRIRDRCSQHGLRSYCFSRVLHPAEERRCGCDAMIVLKISEKAKLCLFEAKWPGMLVTRYGWDRIQGTPAISHFSRQLDLQAGLIPTVAIWQMFIVESPFCQQPKSFDSWGATCVWHKIARNFDQTERNRSIPWTDADVIELVARIPRNFPALGQGRNIRDMLLKVFWCREGKTLEIDPNGFAQMAEPRSLHIPVTFSTMQDTIVAEFCESQGLGHFLFIECQPTGGDEMRHKPF